MKSLMRALPILLLVSLAAALYAHRETTSPPPSPLSESAADIHTLQEQRERIDAQLYLLHQHGAFLPRGIGGVADNSRPQPADLRNN